MSDPKSSYGEPVDEPTDVDDVVGRAQEGLADAEAAGREATGRPVDAEPVVSEPVVPEPVVSETVVSETVVTEPDPVADEAPSAANEWAAEPPSWAVDAPLEDETPRVEETVVVEQATPASDAPTTAYEPAEIPAAAVATGAAGAAVAPQPIFVQAPEAPRPRGNRAAAGAIGVLAALCFAILYLAAWLGFGAIAGDVTLESVGTDALAALTTFSLWVPTVVFFLAFWFLGAIINRGRWGVWVVTGLLVGIAAYGGHLLGALFQAPFWLLTAREGAELVEGQLLAPLAIAAFVFGRELTIWFGAWVAARGKRVTELNAEAQREYERTLEAGPQLVRA